VLQKWVEKMKSEPLIKIDLLDLADFDQSNHNNQLQSRVQTKIVSLQHGSREKEYTPLQLTRIKGIF
jgi:hypothetical protein